MNVAFTRRIKSRFCPHKEINHFIVTACINQWIIVIFCNNIMNKFRFKFFWAVESNCSSDCMSVASSFNNDKKNICRISDQHPVNWFHSILTLFWNQICFYRAVFTWLSKVIEELVWFWFYYALWLVSVFTLVLVLRQSSENCSNPSLNQFWAFSRASGWGQIPWKRNNPCSTFLVIHSCL